MSNSKIRSICSNRRALHDYFIEDRIEAGIVLHGSEVKSIRLGKVSLTQSFAGTIGRELFIFGMHVSKYEKTNIQFNHETKRPRKLLLKNAQINKLIGKINAKGYTLVPLSLYFNNRNKIKVELAIAKGKHLHDKRQSIKEREWKIEKQRNFKEI